MLGNTYVFMYYLHTFGKHTRVSMLLLANEEATHARSFVFLVYSIGYTHAFPDAVSLIPPH